MFGRGVAMWIAVGLGATVAAAGECQWQWANPMPPRVDLHRANTLQRRTVAVGEGGTVLITDDGLRWRRVLAPTGATLRGLDWGAGRWVAVGGGAVLSSASADIWSLETEVAGADLRDVDFGASRFVAVGHGLAGELLTSPDGRAWTRLPAGWATDADSIQWAGDHFVVAAGPEIWTSVDGLSWQRAGEVPVTPSGLTAGATGSRIDLAWDGARVFWGGGLSVFRSADLETWEEVLTVDACPQFSGVLGLYAEAGLVLVSAVATCPTPFLDPQAQISSSRDGGGSWSLDWDELGAGFPAVARTTSGWVGLGIGGDLVASANARTWSCQWGACSSAACADELSAVRGIDDGLVAVGGVGLCGGSAKRLGGGTVATSSSGSRWDAIATDGDWIHDLADDGGRLVGISADGTLWSDDGETWHAGDWPPSVALHSVEWAFDRFIAVGDDGIMITSASGTSWTRGYSGSQVDLHRVLFDGDRVFVLGAGGELWSSDDALNWSLIARLGDATLHGIAGDGSSWVVVGDGGTVLTSSDLVRWTAPVTGLGADVVLSDVAWAGGRFVAVGTEGSGDAARAVVLGSGDGLRWTRFGPDDIGRPQRVAPFAGGWVLVGSERTLLWSPCASLLGRLEPEVVTVPPGATAEAELVFDALLDDTLVLSLVSSAPELISVPATIEVHRGFDRARIPLTAHRDQGDATVTVSWTGDWGTASVVLAARSRSGLWTRPGGRRLAP